MTTNEETIEYMEQRRNLRLMYEEKINRMIASGDYENVRGILERNPEIKPFLENSQWEKLYDYVNKKSRVSLSEEELKKEELAYLASG